MSSRIPVLWAATTDDMKKAANALETAEGILKPSQREKLPPRKNVAAKVHKGAGSTRHGQQSELRDQNQELQKHLTDSQLRVAELEKENTDVQRRLRDCHILLVAGKIDPVLGERVGASFQGKEEERREIMGVSGDLLHELNAFGDMASKQRTQLEEIQTAMMDLTEAPECLRDKRENFSMIAVEMEKACDEAELLLLE